MSLLSSSASGIIAAAMENSVQHRTPASLRDKVIHADIRIDSIEDAPENELVSSHTPTRVEQNIIVSEDAKVDRENAAAKQVWWESAIEKYMGLNEGYESVAVLLIKWIDALDELNTRPETEELYALFTNTFHYDCKIIELDVSTKPQLQMNQHISTFINAHDGSNKLMIVYYTGHGIYHEANKYLELAATQKAPTRGLRVDARLNWDRAEESLYSDDVEGDVLTIMDTCYSSNLQKSGKEDTRTFELLSACAYDQTTATPGPNSFTRALIDGLKELLTQPGGKSFTTFHLLQKINSNPVRRDTPSLLWHRRKHHERHIRLAPLQSRTNDKLASSLINLPRSYVTLRLALRRAELSQEGIDYLARKLSSAFSNPGLIGLQRIDWLGMKPAHAPTLAGTALAMTYFNKWKRIIQKKKEKQKPVDKVIIPAPISTAPALSSPKRKRGADDDDEPLPSPKKSLLDIPSQNDQSPPSPPLSNSSKIDSGDIELS